MMTVLYGLCISYCLGIYIVPWVIKPYHLTIGSPYWHYLIFSVVGCSLHSTVAIKYSASTFQTEYLGFVWLGMMLAAIDAEHLILPDVLVVSLGLLGISTNHYKCRVGYSQLVMTGLSSYLSLSLLSSWYLRWRKRVGLGQGDAKLMSVLSIWFGYYGLCVIVWLASLAALAWIGFGILFRNKTCETPIPFGPFLLGSALFYLLKL